MGKLFHQLVTTCDLSIVTLQDALVKYSELNNGGVPTCLCVDSRNIEIAWELLRHGHHRMTPIALPLPVDSWFVCGPDGCVGSKGVQ